MKITHEFTVERPLSIVWSFFQDVPEVARCLPGAELLSDNGDRTYTGRVSVKLGPMSATFDGRATVTSDAATRTGQIKGQGTDRRGGSRGSVTVLYTLAGDAARTTVNVDADIALSGAAAQFGRSGILAEMSNRLIGEFVACVEGKLAAQTVEQRAQVAAGPVHGLALFWTALLARLRTLLFQRSRNPGRS